MNSNSSKILYKGYWLCMTNGLIVSEIDGGHSSVKGILKAKYLHQQLFNSKNFKMVKVTKDFLLLPNETWKDGINRLVENKVLKLLPVPNHTKPKVNEEALGLMKQILKSR